MLVTAGSGDDEIADPQSLRTVGKVNGETLQDASTGDMIFTVAQIVSALSQDTTLLPGTVILTGSPPGVGMARDPQVWLRPGGEAHVEIERIGALRNPVVQG